MRPDAKHKRTQRRQQARSATVLKAHLAWLHGFPVARTAAGVQWHTFHTETKFQGEALPLTRATLRQAEYALQKLEHDPDTELADLVPEAAQWPARVRGVLNHLKAALHHSHDLPAELPEAIATLPRKAQQRRQRLLRETPELRPVVEALSWAYALDPARHGRLLDWLHTHAAILRELADTTNPATSTVWLFLLAHLAERHGDALLVPLMQTIHTCDGPPLPSAWNELKDCVNAWIDYLNPQPLEEPTPLPAFPATTLADGVHHFLCWLPTQPATVQGHALRFFNLLVTPDILQLFRSTADALTDLTKRARRQRQEIDNHNEDKQAVQTTLTRLRSVLHRPFVEWRLAEWPELFTTLAEPSFEPLHDDLLYVVEQIPTLHKNKAFRESFLFNVAHDCRYRHKTVLPNALHDLRLFLAGPMLAERLAPWLATKRNPFQVAFFLAQEKPAKRQAFYHALGTLVAQGAELDSDDLDTLRGLCESLHDSPTLAERFLELRAAGVKDRYLRTAALQTAERLHAHGIAFGPCVRDLNDWEAKTPDAVTRAINALLAIERGAVAAYFVQHNDFRTLHTLGQQLEGINTFVDLPKAAVEGVPAWAAPYPAELHPVLQQLAAFTPRAERLAKRLLAKDFPANAALEREIAALTKLVNANPTKAPLARRLQNLQQRLHRPRPLSAERRANLHARLEQTAHRAWLDDWLGAQRQAMRAYWEPKLALPNLPDWLWEPRNLMLLNAMERLDERFRSLGFDILRRRCGPPPYHFDDEPANVQFLAKLRRRGIDPTTWLEGLPVEHLTDTTGNDYTVAIERDPWEVLRMGHPFQTCLSPNDANFFSTITNAVDVNKRVLYARADDGAIVGRCLLALTNEGHILTFHVYANTHLDLRLTVTRIVETLATRMGTHVAKRGTVPTLVAPRWYYDGARDLSGRYTFLDEGSPFRTALPTLALAEVLSALQTANGGQPLTDLVWPVLLDLPEFDQRAELVLPLMDQLQGAQLPEATQWRFGVLAHRAGRRDMAQRFLNRHMLPRLVQEIQWHHICHCCTQPVLYSLLELDTTTALRALRQSRPRNVRSDDDEYDPERRTLLAKAHEKLGRYRLAERLRQKPHNT